MCDFEGREYWNGHAMIELRCEKWTFDRRYFDNTVMTQWGFCQYLTLSKNVIGMFVLVAQVGVIFMSPIQDRLGRQWAFFVRLTLTIAGNGFSLLAPSFVAWIAIRAIQATQMLSTYTLVLVWAEEFVDPQKRTLVNFLLASFYSLATILLGPVAWASHDWIKFGTAVVAPFFFLYSYYWLVGESPRWLLSVGRVDDAKKIIKEMAIWNKKEARLPWIMDQVDLLAKNDAREPTEPYRPLELLRYRNLRWKFILLTLACLCNDLVYYSLAFNVRNMPNMFVAFMAQSSVEIPGCILSLLLTDRIGRMLPIILSMFWSSIFCLLCLPAYLRAWNDAYVITFVALAKLGVTVSYSILHQAAGELYPTILRGTGMGVSNFVSNLSFFVMFYVLDSAKFQNEYPF